MPRFIEGILKEYLFGSFPRILSAALIILQYIRENNLKELEENRC
jgi:hypothetical protein